jgi:hypothetical protein
MLLARTLTYSEPETFTLINFYNMLQLLLLLLLHFCLFVLFTFLDSYVALLHNVIAFIYTVLSVIGLTAVDSAHK